MTTLSSDNRKTREQCSPPTGLLGNLAVIIWGIVICLVTISVFQYEWFLGLGKEKELYVKLAPIGFCILVIIALVLTQYWSVAVIANLRANIDKTKGCVYCGNTVAPLVCSQCGVIQWAELTRKSLRENYDMQRAGFLWGYAVFFGHHRFKIFAGVLAIAVVGVLGFSTETRLGRHSRAEAQIMEARQVLDHLLNYRSGLVKLRLMCSSENARSHANGESSTAPTVCTQIFKEFVDSYYAFSWSAPNSLAHLNEIQCAQPGKEKIIELACNVAIESAKSIDYLDGCYRAFVQDFGKNDKDAIKAAHELYRKGKAIGCVIDPLTNPEQQVSPTCKSDIEMLIVAMNVKDVEKRDRMVCYKYGALKF